MGDERNELSKMERLTLTVDEAAHLLGISRGLAYELARSGKLPVIRFGRRILISKWALEKMLNQPNDANLMRKISECSNSRLDRRVDSSGGE